MLNSVSVVITCHNLEKYIGLSIESVLNQDFPGPVEIVVVNDCSTDSSEAVIRSYRGIRCISTKRNLGVLLATVLGIESTSGELVFFLDGDDIWERSKLSTVVQTFRDDSRLGLVTHDLTYIDGNGRILSQQARPGEVMKNIPLSLQGAVTREGILMHSDYVWLGSAFAVHRTLGNLKDFCDFVKALEDPFNTYQDWPLAFWVACQPSLNCWYVHKKMFRYRLHGANHSGDASSVAKAVRNVYRTRNTLWAIKNIAVRFNASANVLRVTKQKLNFYSYLHTLYAGSRWRAAWGFVTSLPYICSGSASFGKETTRFVGVQILGLRRFIRIVEVLK